MLIAYLKLLGLTLIQDGKIFVPKQNNIEQIKNPADYGLQETEEFSFFSGNDDRIFMWIKQPADKNKPVYVVFHGNTGHFGDVGKPMPNENYDRRYRVKLLQEITNTGAGFIAVSLRGYGKSDGKPSEQNFEEDIEKLSEFLKKENYRKIYILGESLGCNAALKLGKKIRAEKMILIAPFSNLHDAVTDRYPEFKQFNLDKYLHHKFDNLSLIENYSNHTEINIFHSKDDLTTSFSHSEKLYDSGQKKGVNIKLFETEIGGHINWNSKEIIEKCCSL